MNLKSLHIIKGDALWCCSLRKLKIDQKILQVTQRLHTPKPYAQHEDQYGAKDTYHMAAQCFGFFKKTFCILLKVKISRFEFIFTRNRGAEAN